MKFVGKLAVICLGLLTLFGSGCKREQEQAGVQIDIIDASQLRPAFQSAAPETRAIVDNVMMSIQEADHAKALADLSALSSITSLTESQRQVVAFVTEQIQKRAASNH